MAHWRSVVASACEQSGRARLPTLSAPAALTDAARAVGADTTKLTLAPTGEVSLATVQIAGGAVVVAIGPERYNEMFASFGNLNRLLAWGHAKVIANLLFWCVMFAVLLVAANAIGLESLAFDADVDVARTQAKLAASKVKPRTA